MDRFFHTLYTFLERVVSRIMPNAAFSTTTMVVMFVLLLVYGMLLGSVVVALLTSLLYALSSTFVFSWPLTMGAISLFSLSYTIFGTYEIFKSSEELQALWKIEHGDN